MLTDIDPRYQAFCNNVKTTKEHILKNGFGSCKNLIRKLPLIGAVEEMCKSPNSPFLYRTPNFPGNSNPDLDTYYPVNDILTNLTHGKISGSSPVPFLFISPYAICKDVVNAPPTSMKSNNSFYFCTHLVKPAKDLNLGNEYSRNPDHPSEELLMRFTMVLIDQTSKFLESKFDWTEDGITPVNLDSRYVVNHNDILDKALGEAKSLFLFHDLHPNAKRLLNKLVPFALWRVGESMRVRYVLNSSLARRQETYILVQSLVESESLY